MTEQCKLHSAHDAKLQSGERRMTKHSEEIDRLQECVVSLTELVKNDREWRRDADKRIKSLEIAPGKKWETATTYVMTGILGIVLGFVASFIGLT